MSDIEQVAEHLQGVDVMHTLIEADLKPVRLVIGDAAVTVPPGTELSTAILDHIGRLQDGKRTAEERVAVLERTLKRVRNDAVACGYVSILEKIGEEQ